MVDLCQQHEQKIEKDQLLHHQFENKQDLHYAWMTLISLVLSGYLDLNLVDTNAVWTVLRSLRLVQQHTGSVQFDGNYSYHTVCLGGPLERFRVLASGHVCGRARGKRSSSKQLLRHKVESMPDMISFYVRVFIILFLWCY